MTHRTTIAMVAFWAAIVTSVSARDAPYQSENLSISSDAPLGPSAMW